ncbi:predicted xylanase/chitin deacetylase [Candidatus Tachikawaea gelatinosa]|uniref:Predicted xylanase/chitin deacetylase n=2 Tax=Candidatus Tachikawaea gelatinosa TaxID=1410383 RepID=A0A090AIU5_9ENTR|nr:predicted xylanase/chitin deacetylase [Candidatus Tachikawaea gelatinosa]
MNLKKNNTCAIKYSRDFIGYGNNSPNFRWPNNTNIAIQFVLNYEEGGESHIQNGDKFSEKFLSDITNAQEYNNIHMSMDSIYEYGSRVGCLRIMKEFQKRNLPLTIFAVAIALEKNSEIISIIKSNYFDIVSHGFRWINYQNINEKIEKKHIDQAVKIFIKIFNKKPTGWYTGRDSPNTRRLIVENGSFIYDSDYYGDDLPFWTKVTCKNKIIKPHLIIPYTLDCNDMRFVTQQGFGTSEHFYKYLRDTFDVLYKEGKNTPKMMSIGMHGRILGRPGRFKGLQNFLDYIQQYKKIWICTRQQIAEFWIKNFPYSF